MLSAPWNIRFDDDEHLFTKKYLNTIFCSDVTNIIYTYYISNRKWTYKTNTLADDVMLINGNITYVDIKHNNISSGLRLDLQTERVFIDDSLCILKMFYDGPYIYVLCHNQIKMIYPGFKNVVKLILCSDEYREKEFISKIKFIKNNTFYTSEMEDQNRVKILTTHNGHFKEFFLININVYLNNATKTLCTKKPTDFKAYIKNALFNTHKKININDIFVNNYNEIIILTEFFSNSKELITIQLYDNIEISLFCKSRSTQILYCDETFIFYADYKFINTKLYGYNRATYETNTFNLDGLYHVFMNDDIIMLRKDNFVHVYERS